MVELQVLMIIITSRIYSFKLDIKKHIGYSLNNMEVEQDLISNSCLSSSTCIYSMEYIHQIDS